MFPDKKIPINYGDFKFINNSDEKTNSKLFV